MRKEKKKLKRQFSAGGVVFKKEDKKILWLVVQPQAGKHYTQGRWQFPKGLIEEGEKTEEAAKREVEEETGVRAEVLEKVDSLKIFFYDENKDKIFKTITLFLMAYQGKGQREEEVEEVSQIAWLPYEEAYNRLTFENEKKVLEKAKELLEERERQPLLL